MTAPRHSRHALHHAGLAALCVCASLACAVSAPRPPPPAPAIAQPALRISERAAEGDARRRASQQLVLDGLTEEILGHPDTARARYDDALKLDPNNPWVALALARSEIFGGDADRGLAQLDRYESLAPQERRSGAHVAGLRGAALARLGKAELARPYLQEARTLAPAIWGDGRLDARELR